MTNILIRLVGEEIDIGDIKECIADNKKWKIISEKDGDYLSSKALEIQNSSCPYN